jgi:hypothetical protein
LHFDLEYKATDFINDNKVAFTICDNKCKAGGNSVSMTILQAKKQILTTNTYVAGGGATERMLTLDMDKDSATITNDPTVYSKKITDNAGVVTAQIDLRVSVSVSRRTQQTPRLNVDLANSFRIGAAKIADKDNGRIVYKGSRTSAVKAI